MSVPQDRQTIEEIQREYQGNWIAVRDGRVIEARPTPHALLAKLRERRISDATVLRIPDYNAPELVGFG